MIFQPTKLDGVYVIQPQRLDDDRGFFARIWCREQFARHGLDAVVQQGSISFNRCEATLRGLHWQAAPAAESKLVRCTMGAIYDVVVDLRPGSATFCQWVGYDLSSQNRRQIYVPEGCAHGFQTLCDDSEVSYQMSTEYCGELQRGVRWNDAAFAIDWPRTPKVMSDRDANLPDFEAADLQLA